MSRRRAPSSNTSTFMMLDKSPIASQRRIEANKTMRKLSSQKKSGKSAEDNIQEEIKYIHFFIDKINFLRDKLMKLQNKRRNSKTLSINNPSMSFSSTAEMKKINDEIKYLKEEIKTSESNIKALSKYKTTTSNEIKELNKRLSIQNLSVGGRTRRTRKRRTMKKRF
jgi:chromosome segregation ATPase